MTRLRRDFLERGFAHGTHFALAPPRTHVRGRLGFHQAKASGSSLEYKDFRDYQPGDDLRHIDWSAYARTDRLTIKRFHEEVNPFLDLILDNSRSMDLPDSPKGGAAAGLAAFFVAAAINAGFSFRTWLASEEVVPLDHGEAPPSAWRGELFGDTRSPDRGLLAPHRFRPRGIRIFVSDLMWRADPTPILNNLCRGASSVLIVQVLARQDVTPLQGGKVRLVDAETGSVRELMLNAASLDRYHQAFARHGQLWRDAAMRHGAVLAQSIAEDLVVDWRLPDILFHQSLVMC